MALRNLYLVGPARDGHPRCTVETGNSQRWWSYQLVLDLNKPWVKPTISLGNTEFWCHFPMLYQPKQLVVASPAQNHCGE